MKRALFIDVRNTTRSQIAEAWFNRLAVGCGTASSCGTMPARTVDERTVQVMHEVGIDIRTQFPKMIDQQTWQRANLVVLMGKDVYPEAFQPTYIWDFQDTTGCPIEDVRALRDRIRLQVQRLIAEIQMENLDAITTQVQWQTLLQYILS
jgi:arsenate reductase (thioredoxin)